MPRVLDVTELSARQVGAMLRSVLAVENVPVQLEAFVLEKSAGNPFFVEEVVASLQELGVLTQADGTVTLNSDLTSVALPTTIQGVVAARIDRLDPRRKRLLMTASVIGREFLVRILEVVCDAGATVRVALEDLVGSELIRAKDLGEALEYMFRHAVTQEVAYNALLKSDRRDLHDKVARAIEGLYPDRIGEQVETLAFHFSRGSSPQEAIHFLTRAGDKAIERYALDEASSYYQQAYDLLVEQALGAERSGAMVQLLVSWSLVFYYRGRFKQLVELIDRHAEEREACTEPRLVAMCLAWHANAMCNSGDYEASVQSGEQAMVMAEDVGAVAANTYARIFTSWSLVLTGRLDAAEALLEPVEVISRKLDDHGYGAFKLRMVLAHIALMRGDHETAMRYADEQLHIANDTGNRRARVTAHICMGLVAFAREDHTSAAEFFREAVASAVDPMYRCWALLWLSFMELSLDNADNTEAWMAQIMREIGPGGFRTLAGNVPIINALAQLIRGDLSGGMDGVRRAHAELRDAGWVAEYQQINLDFVIGDVYLNIAKGEGDVSMWTLLKNPRFLLRHAMVAKARCREHLERALERTERSEVKFREGGTRLRLAELYAMSRDMDAAREQLAIALPLLERQGSMVLERARALEI
jgi:tetratricopeptide (TPR) repeat protein